MLACCARLALAAEPAVFNFTDGAEEARFRRLTAELRCLVCQNQSLADSHADLAGDLRREVYAMIAAGRSDPEVIDFMVERYGDFVRYRPPLSSKTLLLWLGPGLLVVLGTAFLRRSLRRRGSGPVATLSTEQRQAAFALLEADPSDDPGRDRSPHRS
ncbi:MAG: cytochrome c-type biogenesis protein [Gammaproteobacteria bacterium]